MMTFHFLKLKGLLLASVLVFLFVFINYSVSGAASASSGGLVLPKWERPLPAKSCPGGDFDCHSASPVLADMDDDGVLDVVVATNNGHVLAIKGTNGAVLWNVDIASYFEMEDGTHEIHSSPAVADVDADGRPEVVVGAGTTRSTLCTQGGVIVLEHNGNRKSGWPFLTQDYETPPAGCRDTVYSSPALGDLDKDGDLEIVFGGFDKKLYALDYRGHMMAGFPADSALFSRFGWSNLKGRLADTIWSSPALADVDGDGFLDILIGSDEGNFDNTFPHGVGWTCPYASPITPGYCGGSLYVVDRFGQLLPGFPQYIYEHIQSTPALYDLDIDGRPEIFVGTGTFYNVTSPDHPTLGFRLFGWDGQGNDLPGWAGGKVLGGSAPASPAIGDIAGDSNPEIVVGGMDGNLYAWHHTGTAVSGFPMIPLTQVGTTTNFNVPKSFILADYDNDGKMEIFFNQAWTITIVDGNGTQLTTSNFPDGNPLYIMDGSLVNNPAVGDVDGDGQLELVAHNSRLKVWDLPSGAVDADWPMYKFNAARISHDNFPFLNTAPAAITVMTDAAHLTKKINVAVRNPGRDAINWSATASQPGRVSLAPAAGSVSTETDLTTATISANGLSIGSHNAGTITINGGGAAGSPQTIPVTIRVVDELSEVYLPWLKN